MNQFPVLNFQDFIAADGEHLYTTSQQIAVAFGKRHGDVLRQLRAIATDVPPEFNERNFALTLNEIAGPNGATRKEPFYRVTRDGFTLLAMGFTGKKALAFKVAYIGAFNAMATYIQNQRDGLRYRCMEKELECKDSARRGSFHGKGLNQRKQEKPILAFQLAELRALAQPALPLH
jgi:Rha family phage regulatory protein